MADTKISLRPSEFVEGGAVPVDKNLTWKECRFAKFDYAKKDGTVVATTTAARITYVDDDGAEFIQHYSAADPARFLPSADGKRLVAAGTAQALNRSSNFYLLLNALINAGFPESKLDDDISTLDGLYTFNIGVPEPKRTGLVREAAAEGARARVVSVPSEILRMPWDKAPGKGGKTAVGKKAEAAAEDASGPALALVTGMLEKADSVTRQQVATKAVRDKLPAVAKFVFSEAFSAALIEKGLVLDGETITSVGS